LRRAKLQPHKTKQAEPRNPRVYASAALVLQAARATIQLLRSTDFSKHAARWYVPQKRKTNFRTITYYPLSALVTLFVSILENPSQPRNQADLDNMRFVCDFLKTVTIGSETTVATAWPNELARIAEEAMVNARADRGVTRQVKRGNSKFLGASPFCDDQYLQQQPEVLSTSTSSEDIGGGGLSCNYSKQYQENYLMPSSQQLPNAQPIQANSETWQIPTNINFEYLFSDEFVNADPRQISDDSYEPDFTFFM